MAELLYFYPRGHQAHSQPGHPERPERVEVVKQGLEEIGLWDSFPTLQPVEVPDSILTAVHDEKYLTRLQQASAQGRSLDLDTYTTPQSWQLALNAAGGGIAVTKEAWDRKDNFGFALTRPPGHHATASRGMGFCLLNNVAIAAEFLIREEGARRVAIVDLDLHHGNGTQDIFYDRGDVFYFSTHQSPFYPGTGDVEEKGTGEGEGKTINLPLPAGTGDRGFRTIGREILVPMLERIDPEIILISYGFDTHWRDPLGGFLLSASQIAGLMLRLYRWSRRHCQGRFVLFLEGGYDLTAGKVCAQGIISEIMGKDWEDSLGPSPQSEGEGWKDVLQRMKSEWSI